VTDIVTGSSTGSRANGGGHPFSRCVAERSANLLGRRSDVFVVCVDGKYHALQCCKSGVVALIGEIR
jgi:hypothetical protein